MPDEKPDPGRHHRSPHGHRQPSAWRNVVTLGVPTATRTEVAAVLIPLAFVVIGAKVYKLGYVALASDRVYGVPVAPRIQYWIGLAGLLVVFSLFRRARSRWFSGVPWWRIVVVLVAFAAAVKGAKALVSGSLASLTQSWLLSRLFHDALFMWQVLRWDLAFLISFGLGCLAVLALAATRGRQVVLVGLYGLTFALLSVGCLELGYFRITGVNGQGYLLTYLVTQFTSVIPIVVHELRGANLALLALPLPLIAGALVLRSQLTARSALARRAVAVPFLGWLVWPVLFLCLAGPRGTIHPLYVRYAGNVFFAMTRDVVGDPVVRLRTAGTMNVDTMPALWDTRRLRFAATEHTRRFNVVLVMWEAASARYVTPYTPSLGDTPFLAELARRSLVVQDMYVAMPFTSRAWMSLLDGVYPGETTVALNWLRLERRRHTISGLPRLLRRLGYRSAFFTPATRSFEQNAQVIEHFGFDVARFDGDYDTTGFERINYFGYEDRIMLSPAFEWVDQQVAARRPFLLTFMTLVGHHDYQTPTAFSYEYYRGLGDGPLNDYANAMRYIDGFVRDVTEAFDRRGLSDSTVFVIIGDHGQAFGEHVARQHSNLPWEEVVHVPAILYAPSLWPDGGEITGLRQQIDLLPTLADALGLRLEGGFTPGLSLLQPVPLDRRLFISSTQDHVFLALRQGSRKYIYWYRRLPLEVYDVVADPHERVNLASEVASEVRDSLELELLRWRERATLDLLRPGNQ